MINTRPPPPHHHQAGQGPESDNSEVLHNVKTLTLTLNIKYGILYG